MTRKKYLSQKKPLSAQEKQLIDKELNSPEFKAFKEDSANRLLLPEEFSADATYRQIEKRIGRKRKAVLRKYSAAASVLLLITIGCYHLLTSRDINKEAVIVSTNYGETQEIFLPDSSRVVLNSLSSISYPSSFGEEKRNVVLSGEASFYVRKDEERPFSVQANDVRVEVLGTTFNIQAYNDDESINTTLVEGSVAIHANQQQEILKPNQTAIYNKSLATLTIKETNTPTTMQWQQGDLIFDHLPLKEICRILERKEQIHFEIQTKDLQNMRITARFIHQESIDMILDVLSSSGEFTVEKQQETYILSIRNKQ